MTINEGGRPKKSKGAKDDAAPAKEKKEELEAWAAMELTGDSEANPSLLPLQWGDPQRRRDARPRSNSTTSGLRAICPRSGTASSNITRSSRTQSKPRTRGFFMRKASRISE